MTLLFYFILFTIIIRYITKSSRPINTEFNVTDVSVHHLQNDVNDA